MACLSLVDQVCLCVRSVGCTRCAFFNPIIKTTDEALPLFLVAQGAAEGDINS